MRILERIADLFLRSSRQSPQATNDLRTSVIHGCDGPTVERLHDDGRTGTTGGLIPLSVVMERVVAQVAARRLAHGGGR